MNPTEMRPNPDALQRTQSRGRGITSFGGRNLKKGLVVGLVAGLIAAVLVFGLCVWVSTWPAHSDVSLTWSFHPWWRLSNCLAALAALILVGGSSGVLATFRPDFRDKI
jgi:hypothetical protein